MEVKGLQNAITALQGFEARIAKLQQFWDGLAAQTEAITDEARKARMLAVIQNHQDKLLTILSHLRDVKGTIITRLQARIAAQGTAGLHGVGQIPDISPFSNSMWQEEQAALAFQTQNQLVATVSISADASSSGDNGMLMLLIIGFVFMMMMKRRY